MRIGILGSGSWATALVKMLTDNGNTVNWWIRNSETITYIQKSRHHPHYLSTVYFDLALLSLNENILSVIDQSDVLVVAVPSAYVETALREIPTNALQGKKIISAVKGILPDGNLLDFVVVRLKEYGLIARLPRNNPLELGRLVL